MNRCLIFLASLFFAFVAVSSASAAGLPSWQTPASTSCDTDSGYTPWSVVPAPRLLALAVVRFAP
jgi:hypothetical protein